MTRLTAGNAAVAAPSPIATAKSSEPTPSPVPTAKGIARQKPRRMPCARLIMLFGPGVTVAIRQNIVNGAIASSAISSPLSVLLHWHGVARRERRVLNQSDMTILGNPADGD